LDPIPKKTLKDVDKNQKVGLMSTIHRALRAIMDLSAPVCIEVWALQRYPPIA
jgi:hypothetical protein